MTKSPFSSTFSPEWLNRWWLQVQQLSPAFPLLSFLTPWLSGCPTVLPCPTHLVSQWSGQHAHQLPLGRESPHLLPLHLPQLVEKQQDHPWRKTRGRDKKTPLCHLPAKAHPAHVLIQQLKQDMKLSDTFDCNPWNFAEEQIISVGYNLNFERAWH